MAKERIALYPGSFDPTTLGHLDIIRRGAKLVDRLVVGLAINTGKSPMFTLDERTEMVGVEVEKIAKEVGAKIEVHAFQGLLMHYAEKIGAQVILRGLRAVTDFDYEFQMVGMNARLNAEIETVFLMASEKHQFIASRLVKEIGMMGGNVRPFLTARIAERLEVRCRERGAVQR